jgi:glyoxylase-like metal-dependent hydrolase (beta-lactamase superfamily II)
MTLDGTNTWVLSAPGARRAVVIDPGPDDEAHLRAVRAVVQARGCRVGAVLLTHGHADHSAGARRCALEWAVGVRALDAGHRLGAEGRTDGDVVEVDGLRLDVVATPGHSHDSLCFALRADGAVLTGDTVLGRGTAVIHHPDGELGAYLDSLHRLEQVVCALEVSVLLPGHGPVLDRPADVVRGYLTHRAERLDQVRGALDAGARTAREVIERVYQDVDPRLWPAAELTVRAQLDYLARPHDGPSNRPR